LARKILIKAVSSKFRKKNNDNVIEGNFEEIKESKNDEEQK